MRFLPNRLVDELGLAAFAMRRDHQSAGHSIRHNRPAILADDVETEIDPGSTAGRGQNIFLVHIKDIRLKLDKGEGMSQLIDVSPMRGCAPAIQKTRGSKHKNTGADGDEPGPARMSFDESADEVPRRRFIGVAPARNDDGVRLL